MEFELRSAGAWQYLCLPSLSESGIIHGFFTKASPSSQTLHLEKKRFLDTFGLQDVFGLKQEHGDIFHVLGNNVHTATGDGIIVVDKGIAGIIKTADCLPVIITDPDYPMAAIVHAGWRGTAKRITSKVVRGMCALGAKRERLVALLGPSIGPCCYVVKEDVYDVFTEQGFPPDIFTTRADCLFLNIRAANARLLRDEGVALIYDTDLCTCCQPDMFASYRRGDRELRQINFVSLSK